MKTLILGVEGMACGHCKAAVEAALTAVAGVQSAVADLDKKQASVVCEDSVQTATLWDAVEAIGFDPVRS